MSSTRRSELQILDRNVAKSFEVPTKKINDGDGLNFWLVSTAYRDLTVWLLQLNRSMFPTKDADGKTTLSSLSQPPTFSAGVCAVQSMIQGFSDLVDKAPPSTGPRRFGNVAFRDWYNLAEDSVSKLLADHFDHVFETWAPSEGTRSVLVGELRAYLMGSFGSAQRLDYGTGHELSFIAFLGCLWKLGVFRSGEERTIVMGAVQPYLSLMRKLILTYTLEPAGSHGVWGLDDHSFVPYIFGSAQFGPPINPADRGLPTPTEGSDPSAPPPSSITKLDMVQDYKDSNMYFSAVQFIYDVKKGPFWEHSPVLFDISGIKDGWGKINKGMLKMYAAEVLGKFPVVQHFPFGSIFEWKRDPEAEREIASIHSAQQPPVSKDTVRPPASDPGMTAPWATSTVPSSTAMPSTRAPWAGRSPPSGASISSTAAPWAQTQRAHPAEVTAAHWAQTRRPSGPTNAAPGTN